MARWCQRPLSKVRRMEVFSNIPVGCPHLFLKSPCSQASALHPHGLTPPLPLSISTSYVQHLWTSAPSPGPWPFPLPRPTLPSFTPSLPDCSNRQHHPPGHLSLNPHSSPTPPSPSIPTPPDLSMLCPTASILLQAITSSLLDYRSHLPTGLPAASLTSLPLPSSCHTTLCHLLLLPPSLGRSYALHLKFMYLFLAVLGLHCFMGFSVVAPSGGHSPVVMCELLVAVAFLVVEHGL